MLKLTREGVRQAAAPFHNTKTKARNEMEKPDITDSRLFLTDADMRRESERAARMGWGFTRASLERQFERFEKGDYRSKAAVYYLLTECNYHTEAAALAEYDVEKARRLADQMFGV